MKKLISLLLIAVLMVSTLFVLTGCDKKDGENGSSKSDAKKDLAEITYEYGNKSIISLSVPKKEDGTPKYEFTTEKPENMTSTGTFYLSTDTVNFSFATSGLVYNTGVQYKEKYGETKASFDGYLDFINDESLSSRPRLSGMEELEINGRKAIRYYNRSGSSSDYTYYGFFYKVAIDDLFPGSSLDISVGYNKAKEELPKESEEFDQETLDIINSLKVTAKE